jgi:putative hydrolase of the HAD superfamily
MEDFLTFLKEQNIRTGVISNITYCGEVVEERINNLLPEHNFEFIIATSEYMFRKPNKRIFELALEKAGLQPEDVWYIGDNYLCDVVGARSAGIFPVWYIGATADPQGEDDVLTISHWDELRKLIGEL